MAHKFIHSLALLATCALLGLSACGSEAPQAASESEAGAGQAAAGQSSATSGPSDSVQVEDKAGSIALSLEVGGKKLDSMNYAVVGSGFSTSGSLDVSHSSKVSGVVGGIPFGSNYALTMNGKGAGEAPLDCSGSTSFDLNSVGPLPVTIAITCKEPDVIVEPPPTPVPVPPFAVFALACMLAAMGVAARRQTTKG
ncbi:MAG: hypothetical protein WDO69_15805 [Pseudomonadota bacterium]